MLSLTKSRAKAQRRKEKRKDELTGDSSLRLSLRLCAFARNCCFLVAALLFLTVSARASVSSQFTISLRAPSEVRVEAELSSPMRSWSFRNAYAGALGFAERIKDFQAVDASGRNAGAKKIASGEFRSERDATRISYTVDLSSVSAADVPHISWLTLGRGFLMFADLIPRDIERLSAEFKLSFGSMIESAISPDKKGRYEVLEPESAVFLVGTELRKTSDTVSGMPLDFVVSGTWPFKENRAFERATQIMKHYLALTRHRLPRKSSIMIAPFRLLPAATWKAETRGSTLVLVMDPDAQQATWIGQLRVIFTHELFHLWVPNALKLEGDYDWFFEGFTLYIALCTAVQLRVIDFGEYLRTLSGVYDAYTSHPDDISLIEASESRWTSSNTNVYVKGMLVAFLYDLKIRKESGGATVLADRYRELFDGRVAANANGNEAIISLLDSAPAMSGFAQTYVAGKTKIELEKILPAYGLKLDSSGKNSQIRVSQDLNAEQRQLLRSLGYRD